MINRIISKLKKEYPNIQCSLKFKNALQLLIATILAAQCTDERVNIVTKELFKKYKTAQDFAKADLIELENIIKPTGFYHSKAKNIIECCKIIVEKHNGQVPQTMEELIKLPGVGRKTANVVLHNAFGKSEGIVVDTHCKRLSQRLGFTKNEDPNKIEKDLIKIVPKEYWNDYGNLMVFHGRTVCNARKPRCQDCLLQQECPKVGVNLKNCK